MLIGGIALGIYGLFCIIVGVTKMNAIWKTGKVQGFVKLMGEKGTQIFFSIWGLAALAGGIVMIIFGIK